MTTPAATVWFTGVPAAGKTTLSRAVQQALAERSRPAYRLDGDELRRTLCADLGFDHAARTENVRRVAQVARILGEAGVIALVALVSPYAEDRLAARQVHEQAGLAFVEVHLDTPLELCRERDPKGLYGRSGRGEMRGLTGVDAPYEPPTDPEVRLAPGPVQDGVAAVLAALDQAGVL